MKEMCPCACDTAECTSTFQLLPTSFWGFERNNRGGIVNIELHLMGAICNLFEKRADH